MVLPADYRIRPDCGSVRRVLLFVMLCWGLSSPAWAQFQITDFAPGDGAVGVPTLTTLQLTFSAPLDVTVQYPSNDNFFMVIEQYPDSGGPLDLRIEGDGNVLAADFLLDPDTQYWLIVHDARSTAGESLDRVYHFTFSTGPSLPSGSISGLVTMDADPVSAVLVEAIPLDSLFADYNTVIGGYAVTDGSGHYVINHVPAGEYAVIAMTDDDRDTEPTFGEGLGGYDEDGDRMLDLVTVADGSSVTGTDISIETLMPYTAGHFAAAAETAASALLPGETVETVGAIGASEVEVEGTAFAWLYVFRGQTTDTPLSLFEIGGWLLPGGPPLDGMELTVPVPDGWIDSDLALTVAETNGGADFRASYPEARIMAILAGTTALFGGNPSIAGKATAGTTSTSARAAFRPGAGLPADYRDRDPSPHRTAGWLETARSMSISEDRPTWFIGYDSDMDSRMFLIDAITGELIGAPGLATRAGDSQAAAQETAANWQSDAVLAAVAAAGSEGISEDGLSAYWAYGFYSPSSGTALMVTATAGLIGAEVEIDANDLPSTQPLPPGWIDSDAAAAVSEANSFGFRGSHDLVYVQAILSTGMYPGNPDQAVWLWYYMSQNSPDELMVFVDALTGAIVTSTEPPALPGLQLTLDAPYPNPTRNAAYAVIRSPSSSGVRLVVEDLLGRRIADLGLVGQAAGEESVRIDTGSWADGLYFVRLLGPGTTVSRPLVVVR